MSEPLKSPWPLGTATWCHAKLPGFLALPLAAPHSTTEMKVPPECQVSSSVNLDVDQFLRVFCSLGNCCVPRSQWNTGPFSSAPCPRLSPALALPCPTEPAGPGEQFPWPPTVAGPEPGAGSAWAARRGSKFHPSSRRTVEAQSAQASKDTGLPAIRQSSGPSPAPEGNCRGSSATVQTWPLRGLHKSVFCLQISHLKESPAMWETGTYHLPSDGVCSKGSTWIRRGVINATGQKPKNIRVLKSPAESWQRKEKMQYTDFVLFLQSSNKQKQPELSYRPQK